MDTEPVDRHSIHEALDGAQAAFHVLVGSATPVALRRRSNGTRWTNEQLLFHMLFGYIVVRRLLHLVRFFGKLPDGVSRTFAGALNAGTRPFHWINYVTSCAGAKVFRGDRMVRELDRTMTALHRRLDRESDAALASEMHFPTGWDPFFTDTMSLADVYRYGTLHFDFHRRQLTLEEAA